MAYCLLGIFGVGMTLLYGEGGREAFRRLQEEIIKTSNDLSIFAWIQPARIGPLRLSALAESPSQFANCFDIPIIPTHPTSPTVLTNETIKAQLGLCFFDERLHGVLGGASETNPVVYAIPLVEVSSKTYFRSSGQPVVMRRQAKQPKEVSLVNRVEKHLSAEFMSKTAYKYLATEDLPPGYVLSKITGNTGFTTAEFMFSKLPKATRYYGLPGPSTKARRQVWVEIRHIKRSGRFVFPVNCEFPASDPRQQMTIWCSSSKDLLSLEARGKLQENRLILEEERHEVFLRVTASSLPLETLRPSREDRYSPRPDDVLMLKVTAHESLFFAVEEGIWSNLC